MKIGESILNIIFDAGKGSSAMTSREGRVGEPFGNLPRPSRAGYEFLGWYLNDKEIISDTLIEGDTDIRLTAKWERKKGAKKVSIMQKQRVAVIALSALIVVLIAVLLVANHVVAIYSLTDTWEKDGVTYTEKYTLKKSGGVYKMYAKDGTIMETVPDSGYTSQNIRYEVYIAAKSGNQYLVNTSTGEYESYAVVDYDGSIGETLNDVLKNKKVMMYSRIKQDDTFSIEVTNEYGTYKFYRTNVQGTNGKYSTVFRIAGAEESPATYDPELFASLCVACGYSTTEKLNLSLPEAPRLPDGSIDYSVYGLDNPTTKYTIVKASFDANGYCTASDSYTVFIGDAILSGNGYYAKMPGRDAVYIVGSDITTTVMQPIEALITPMVIYPMGVSTYSMVENFLLGKVGQYASLPEGTSPSLDVITGFTYIDLAKRENTLYSGTPYQTFMDLMKGYKLNTDAVSTVLQNLYSMEFISCKKLGITKAALTEYHLDENIFMLTFDYDPDVASGGSDMRVNNALLISQRNPNGTYYVASTLYDMIVEVDEYYLSFLQWGQSRWYESNFFQNNIAYIKDIVLEQKNQAGQTLQKFLFTLDNSKSDQTSGVSSSNLQVRYGEDGRLMDYQISETTLTDKGTYKTKTYTAVDNFRRLYSHLLSYSIEADVNEAEFKKLTGKTLQEYIASNDCTGSISYHIEDMAKTQNKSTKSDGTPYYTENNSGYYVIRFYRYSEGNMFLTIEAVDGDNAPDPTKAQGRFYVDADYWNQIIGYAQNFVDGTQMIPNPLA